MVRACWEVNCHRMVQRASFRSVARVATRRSSVARSPTGRNAWKATIDWQFTNRQAGVKLKRLYAWSQPNWTE